MSRIREKNRLDEERRKNAAPEEQYADTGKHFGLTKLKKLKIHMYKYVPPCPKCHSVCTGRYVRTPMTKGDRDYMEIETLKYGEIVRFINRTPTKNLFCVDCDYTWHGLVETRWYNMEEIEREVEQRGTYEAYIEALDEADENRNKRGFLNNLF